MAWISIALGNNALQKVKWTSTAFIILHHKIVQHYFVHSRNWHSIDNTPIENEVIFFCFQRRLEGELLCKAHARTNLIITSPVKSYDNAFGLLHQKSCIKYMYIVWFCEGIVSRNWQIVFQFFVKRQQASGTIKKQRPILPLFA